MLNLRDTLSFGTLGKDVSNGDNQQFMQNEKTFNEALITDRAQGIKQIETQVTDLNQAFNSLNNIIVEQQPLFNDIENNIELATNNTTGGVHNIQKASVYQRRARYKLCWLLLIFIVVIVIIIAYFSSK